MAGRKVRAPDKTLAVVDHNVPTTDRSKRIADPESAAQIADARRERARFRHRIFQRARPAARASSTSSAPSRASRCPARRSSAATATPRPTAPSARSRYGIGTSEVEHVLATQTLIQPKRRTCACASTARCRDGVTAKDIILAIIGEIGTAGGTGHVIEYAGEAIRALSMEGRMTVCNMSIEGGARAGLIAPDEKTFAYLKGRPKAPKGDAWDVAHALLGDARIRRGRAFRPRGQARRRQAAAASSPGAPAPSRWSRSPAACRCPPRSPTRPSAAPPSARSTTWA